MRGPSAFLFTGRPLFTRHSFVGKTQEHPNAREITIKTNLEVISITLFLNIALGIKKNIDY